MPTRLSPEHAGPEPAKSTLNFSRLTVERTPGEFSCAPLMLSIYFLSQRRSEPVGGAWNTSSYVSVSSRDRSSFHRLLISWPAYSSASVGRMMRAHSIKWAADERDFIPRWHSIWLNQRHAGLEKELRRSRSERGTNTVHRETGS